MKLALTARPALAPRLAFTLLLVAGLLMTGTGGALAVTGIAGDGSAGIAQYDNEGGDAPDERDEGGDTLGDRDAGGNEGDREPAGTGGGGSDGTQAAVQTAVAGAGAAGLPFTGLVVFPLLLAGVALTAAGGVLRLRLGRERRS